MSIRKRTIWLGILLLVVISGSVPAAEFRGILVDSWDWGSGWGIVDPAATQQTVDYIRSCNANVVMLEVRKRADAYYNSSIEPVGTNISPAPGYDCLADMIAKAHAAGIAVHTWFVPYRVWSLVSPPPHTTPEHIYYLHPEWFSQYENGGTMWDGRWTSLDPGLPEVEDYVTRVALDMVQRYDIDGFLLDYIRYYGIDWGYNPAAVARFNAEYGRTGSPSSTDPLWLEWRRDRVSNLVRRLYLEIKAIKPRVKVAALVWRTASSGRSDVLQDWDKWMANHWLDYVSPMNYTTDNNTFHTNNADSLGRGYGRHIYAGLDCASNTIGNTAWQASDSQSAGFPGATLFSYGHPNPGSPDLMGFRDALLGGPYSSPDAVPGMPWLETPTRGYLRGYIRDASGDPIYPATAVVASLGLSAKDSGTGFYGFCEVEPGSYTVRAEAPGFVPDEESVTIAAGQVASLDFTLQPETVPPVISNVRAESIEGTHTQIRWDTNEPATSQVEYGPDAGYGTASAENMARVTSHSVHLIGLRALTTYHFRARSYDAARNVCASSDFTFTTSTHDTATDIIIDNLDSACRTYGEWWSGTAAAGKYGADYFYTTTADPGRYTIFRPEILIAGPYDVYIWYTQSSNRSTQAKWRVYNDGGMQELRVNEQTNGGKWNLIATDRPFAGGSSGYVATYSDTGEGSSVVVIADAVKFVYKGDAQPPAAPGGLACPAFSHTQAWLRWNAAADNMGVLGYRVYRNGCEVCYTTGLTYTDVGLSPNTAYSYSVRACDAAQNWSPASSPVAVHTLSQPPAEDSLVCSVPPGVWHSSPEFTFTAVSGFGPGAVEYYRCAWDQEPTHPWSWTDPQWGSGSLSQTASGPGSWYLHVTGYSAENVANGNWSYGPYRYDPSAVQTVAEAKGLSDGAAAVLSRKVVSACFGDHFYVCENLSEQVSGIRVNGPAPPEGSVLDIAGLMGTVSGERVITQTPTPPATAP